MEASLRNNILDSNREMEELQFTDNRHNRNNTRRITENEDSISRTSALLSGFAMVAMVELTINFDTTSEATYSETVKCDSNQTNCQNETVSAPNTGKKIPTWVLILYSIITCLLVGIHLLALMISTCILPQIEALSPPEIDDDFIRLKKSNSIQFDSIFRNKKIITPDKKFHKYIELAWLSSTVLGIFLFLIEICLVCYIKFYPISESAALLGGVFMLPIMFLFILFTIKFYRGIADFKLNLTKEYISQIV